MCKTSASRRLILRTGCFGADYLFQMHPAASVDESQWRNETEEKFEEIVSFDMEFSMSALKQQILHKRSMYLLQDLSCRASYH